MVIQICVLPEPIRMKLMVVTTEIRHVELSQRCQQVRAGLHSESNSGFTWESSTLPFTDQIFFQFQAFYGDCSKI